MNEEMSFSSGYTATRTSARGYTLRSFLTPGMGYVLSSEQIQKLAAFVVSCENGESGEDVSIRALDQINKLERGIAKLEARAHRDHQALVALQKALPELDLSVDGGSDRLRDAAPELLSVLKAVQWNGRTGLISEDCGCPCCSGSEESRLHYPGCALYEAIKKAERS